MTDNILGWHYCGKYKTGDKVRLLDAVDVRQGKGRFKDIFKDTDDSYIYKTVYSTDVLTIKGTPQNTTGAGRAYYPGTYSLIMSDGGILIGIHEYLIESVR